MESTIFNRSCWIIGVSKLEVREEFEHLLIEAGFNVVGFIDHHYAPQGYTIVWLLAESHAAIHTFPENDSLYFELSSCVNSKSRVFWDSLEVYCNEYSLNCNVFSENTYKI